MKKKWVISILVLAIFVLIAMWGMNVGKHAYHLFQVRQEIKGLVQGELSTISPEYMFTLLQDVNDDLNVLDKNLKFLYPFFKLLRGTPSQIEPSIIYLDSMVDFALLLEGKISPVVSNGIDSQVDILQFLTGIFDDREFIRQILVFSYEIPKNRNSLDISLLPIRFQDDFLLLDKFLPVIQLSGEVLPHLPEIIGLDSPANYLLLALNQDELRGGGGFITAMGTATIRNLTDINFDLQDSYQFDDSSKEYPLPPQPLQTFMLAGIWLPRDGNWSADFPTSARKVQELFRISSDVDTNGVIAFDQEAVYQIMGAIGPIQVDPLENIWVGENNVIQYMQDSWGSKSHEENWWANRKDFIGVLGKAILETVTESKDIKQIIELAKVSRSLMQSGHLLFYFNDSTVQSILNQQKLDHSINVQTGDFIYWVDSNVGFNKMDAIIQRSLSYQIDLSNIDQPTAKLTMKFVNPVGAEVICEHIASYGEDISYSNMQERCYWDYWRVYRPQGSQIASANITAIPAEQLLTGQAWQGPLDQESDLPGFEMAGGMMVVPTFSQQEIELTFNLPREIIEIRDGKFFYSLTILKQLGLDELPVEFQIKIPEWAQLDKGPDFLSNSELLLTGSKILFESENQIVIEFSKK
jgi:hypothetical protein